MTEATNRAALRKSATLLSIGQQVDVSTSVESRVFTAPGRIDDWEGDRCCVAILMPGAGIGAELQVTARRSDGLHKFSMRVVGIRSVPAGLWLVCSGPYQKIQRRQHVRERDLQVTIRAWRSGQRLTGVVLQDISGGGIGIQSKTALDVGDLLRLEFALPEKAALLIRVIASVQRIGDDDSYGLQFRALPYVTGEGIVSWVFSRLRRRLGNNIL